MEKDLENRPKRFALARNKMLFVPCRGLEKSTF